MWCVMQRKKTLMVEYKQLKKANAFVDKRIGGLTPQMRLLIVELHQPPADILLYSDNTVLL